LRSESLLRPRAHNFPRTNQSPFIPETLRSRNAQEMPFFNTFA
jgi:hypothetical protein